jgi:hypothetical protein
VVIVSSRFVAVSLLFAPLLPWSIFFAALTLAVSLYITSLQNYSSWSVMAAGASVIALTLLIYEKYNG